MKKTKLEVISIYDGKQDATDLFVSLIADKIRAAKPQKPIAFEPMLSYNGSGVQLTKALASGLCG